MLHGSQIYIVETAALLIALFTLTILWRIARALEDRESARKKRRAR